ncbi:MAG: hypothetical protein GX858_00530, partial [Clostridiales bacterium]|nr:hypothetical protein [Clostridiales bacterium]
MATPHAEDKLHRGLEEQAADFQFAPYSQEAAEATAASDYSYWGSTVKVFLQNRLAATLLVLLLILVLFTFIQPLLPMQYRATLIINHPITGRQLSNIQPGLSNVMYTVPEGTKLVITPWKNDEWSAVSNVLMVIRSRQEFEVIELLDDWAKVSYQGQEGYVKNDFTTKLRLPEDPTQFPFQSRSNFQIELYSTPENY